MAIPCKEDVVEATDGRVDFPVVNLDKPRETVPGKDGGSGERGLDEVTVAPDDFWVPVEGLEVEVFPGTAGVFLEALLLPCEVKCCNVHVPVDNVMRGLQACRCCWWCCGCRRLNRSLGCFHGFCSGEQVRDVLMSSLHSLGPA